MNVYGGNTTELDPLKAFCRVVIANCGDSRPPSEEGIAEQFVTYFRLGALSSFDSLKQLCVQLGIEVAVRAMPEDLRGHNSSYNGSRTIVISANQAFPGADAHTILHELREILEHVLKELGFHIAKDAVELEQRAEHFAMLVLSGAFLRKLPTVFENAGEIDKKWLRYGAYSIIAIGALFYVATCFFLPWIEDASARFEKDLERNVRT